MFVAHVHDVDVMGAIAEHPVHELYKVNRASSEALRLRIVIPCQGPPVSLCRKWLWVNIRRAKPCLKSNSEPV